METKQIINGLLDRADRVADQSAGRIMKRAAKRLEELEAKQRWIPVTERLPEKHIDGQEVLTLNQNKNEHDVWYVEVVQASPHWFTHWMPLPEPTKEV